MRASLGGTLAAVLAGALIAASAAAIGQELELRRVMLSAGGVGYFEYEARVDGDATLELSVRLDQVDDVMKSLVVYDDQGVAGAVRLAGRSPVEQIFRDLPFGPEALESPVALLNALPGAGVRASGQRRVEGRLVRVVPESHTVGEPRAVVTRHRVTVMTDAGLQSFLLEDADAVSFSDPALAAQVEEALAAVAAHRTRDRRTLHVTSNGAGPRTVRVGYVVAAPLWKASYRLSMGPSMSPSTDPSATDAERARLQGWAVLENMSGQDWEGVELTLVSGNPVTFRQALYAAYYADRPEVPVEVLGRVLPTPDNGAVAAGSLELQEEALRREQRMERALGAASPGRVAPAPALESTTADTASSLAIVREPEPTPAQARVLAAASTEAATSVRFRVPRAVSVTSGQSLLIPIVDRAIPARRLALYQPQTHARHPLATVEIRNDGETGLPPGVLTLYEVGASGSAFVGDAQLSPLPAGEERLVSYALDQKTLVDRERSSTRTVASGRIVDGVLELRYAEEERTAYRIEAPAAEPRTVLVEHPRKAGWRLEAPRREAVALTESHYRIERSLEASATTEVPVVLARPLVHRVALTNLRTPQLVQYAANGELDPALRAAFGELARLSRAVDDAERRLERLGEARGQIHQEQERIRGNLSRVPRDTDLHKRYLAKLDAQEDRLEALARERERAEEALDAARATLAEHVRGLET